MPSRAEPSKARPSLAGRDGHLFGPGHKRILALDGGGVRGAMTIAFLERLEELVAEIEGRKVRLCDWFDLIGGTSTGAIIATGLALGYSAAQMRVFYEKLAPRVFRKPFFRLTGWQAKFDSRKLLAELVAVIGTRSLDSEDLATGLCLVLKRMDTGSSWILLNNPRSAFWETPQDKSFVGNRHLPLANLVRASTAAPVFFDPEPIEIGGGHPPGLFVDGGLTPHNNPALILLLAATLRPYGLNWQTGPDNLTIISIGTGSFRPTLSWIEAKRLRAIGLAIRSLLATSADSVELTMTLMSWLGTSPLSWPINSELGDLAASTPPSGPLFRFLRYDVKLEQDWLAAQLGETISAGELRHLRQIDDPAIIPAIYQLGRKAAAFQMRREHLCATPA
ncbi:Patatin-like phospholipase [Rhizobiales bacterium GAS191]|nr:Patatin-like phospholipase [Rhizobiales bacterium GAS191]